MRENAETWGQQSQKIMLVKFSGLCRVQWVDAVAEKDNRKDGLCAEIKHRVGELSGEACKSVLAAGIRMCGDNP